MLLFVLLVFAQAKLITIRNDVPRLDNKGQVMDAHSGNILYVKGTYFLYGERYGNATGMVQSWAAQGAPQVGVYTSTDLVTWKDEGLILPNNTAVPTQWVPWVFFDAKTSRFVAWFGIGNWGVATSTDGLRFSFVRQTTSRLGGQTDGNMVFVDDDGQGYIIFSATDQGHQVSIELLTPDYLDTTKQVIGPETFPDSFVESPMLFKRNGVYYATYGVCCCACREGAGLAVFTSSHIQGPWTRQFPNSDINCPNTTAPLCPGDAFSKGVFTIPAQGYTVSWITTTSGPVLIWLANRWLQAPKNDPKCMNLCSNPGGDDPCTSGQPDYRVGQDPTYWTPLDFGTQGDILSLHWKDSFQLELP